MPLIAGAGLMVIVLATDGLPVRVLPPVSSVAKALQAFLVRRERVTLGPCNIAIRVYLQWSAS